MIKILQKYKVQNPNVIKTLKLLDERDDGAHYDWDKFHDDTFVRDVKLLLLNYFEPIAKEKNCTLYEATKATSQRWLLVSFLCLSFVATLPSYLTGRYWALFVTPQLAWVLQVNYWHDCLHFSQSSDWRVNAWLPYAFPLLSSPWLWYHQHVIGHHAYTNIALKDPDLAHAPQLLREHKSIPWKKLHETQGSISRIGLVWSIAVGLGLNLLNDMKTNLKLSYNNVVPYAPLKRPRLIAHIFEAQVCLPHNKTL